MLLVACTYGFDALFFAPKVIPDFARGSVPLAHVSLCVLCVVQPSRRFVGSNRANKCLAVSTGFQVAFFVYGNQGTGDTSVVGVARSACA